MKNNYPKFVSKQHLSELVDGYFDKIEQCQPKHKTNKTKGIEDDVQENKENFGPATIAGLALYLGFNSREQFESYENKGKFADCIKRARLRIEDAYEKKLHQQSSGVVFALKTFGWNEKDESKKSTAGATKTMRVVIVESGPKPAASEKEVDI